MIGRAAMQNPMIFKDKIKIGYKERKKLFIEYVELCRKFDVMKLSDLRIKSTQFFREFEGSAKFRNELFQSKTVNELISKLE